MHTILHHPNVKKAKQFVQENTTLVACAATAVIASKLTYDIAVDHCLEKMTVYVATQENKNAMLQDAVSFLDHKGMWQEFINFAPRLQVD